jgi:hypothetical protein
MDSIGVPKSDKPWPYVSRPPLAMPPSPALRQVSCLLTLAPPEFPCCPSSRYLWYNGRRNRTRKVNGLLRDGRPSLRTLRASRSELCRCFSKP